MANNGPLQSSTYGNGYEVTYTYDEFGRLSQEVRGNDTYTYLYDARGNLSKIQKNGIVWEEYSYDIGDRLVKVHSDDHSMSYHHDNMDRTTGTFYTFQGENQSTQYTYGADGRSGITTLPNGGRISRTYDNLGRESNTDLNPIPGSDPTFRTQRTFLSAGGNKTTSLIDTYSNYRRISGNNTVLSSYTYTYDSNGNIQSITDQDGNTTTYTYDGLNQLIKVEDTKTHSTYTYTYDAGGNLTEEKIYMGTGDTALFLMSIPYSYGNDNWKDLLTSYMGDSITYDAIGNPLSYRNGMQFTWDGRKLTNFQKGNTSASYVYNVNGIREKKTVNGIVTDFFLDGNTILAQKTNGNTMWFLYDSNGTRVGFTYLGQTYYYAYNAQGDVVQILDSSSNVVVEYEYGPWGEMRNITGSMDNTIGEDNPFRYRGYYYDTESGLYYLNTRYYDPMTHRFINVDAYVSKKQDINGNNMFVYCGNNPINRFDPNGMFWEEIWNFIKGLFGAESTTSTSLTLQETEHLPDIPGISFKTGTESTKIHSKHGDSSKPLSVYANQDTVHPVKSSSAGLKLNIWKCSLDLRVGVDDTSFNLSYTNGNTTDTVGLKLNLSELKVGFEGSSSIENENHFIETNYSNLSLDGWGIAGLLAILYGQPATTSPYAYGG